MSNTDTDALVQKLRYMGRQYAAGQASRGGSPRKHYLEEAADTIEQAAARESALHDAVCQAVSIMNMAVEIARSENGRKAKDILREALVAYADAAIRTTKATPTDYPFSGGSLTQCDMHDDESY